MQYYDNKLSATYDELIGGEAPIVKEGTLRSWLSRGTVLYARRAHGRGVKALIAVETLPPEVKQVVVERYGLPEQPTPTPSDLPEVYRDTRALDYYNGYTYDSNGEMIHLSSDLIHEYTTNASVLNALTAEAKRLRLMGNKLNNNRTDIREIIRALSEKLRETTGHTLPKSARRLGQKVREYDKKGYSCLISGSLGNANSRKITREGGEFLVALKLSRHPRYNNTQIFEAYNANCHHYGWDPLESEQALRSYLYSPAIKPLWYGHIRGELEKYKKYGYKHKTTMPMKRDSLWYIDGTKLNLYYCDAGKLATLNVVEVLDAYSGCFLGYSPCEKEDFAAQYRAVRMALEVAGQRPWELVHDNQGGQTGGVATEWLDRVALVHRVTQPYRPQSKIIEMIFGQFQGSELFRYPWFTGTNITGKSFEGRPDEEWLAANLHLLPQSREEVIAQYAEARERWNRRLHPSTGIPRWEMYRTSVNEQLLPLSEADKEELYLLRRPRTITFRGEGLTMELDKQEYSYDAYRRTGEGQLIIDYEWRTKNIDRTFVVRYDPTDLSRVYLYTEEGEGVLRYERQLQSKVVIHRAIQEQGEEDHRWIRSVEEQDKRARIEMEARSRAITALYKIGEPSLEADPKTLRKDDLALLDRLTDERTAELEERYRARGVNPLAHHEGGKAVTDYKPQKVKRIAAPVAEEVRLSEPIELGERQKATSMTTWDEVKVVQQIRRPLYLPTEQRSTRDTMKHKL